ncbi:MAG: PAS domain S-box protein [Anaerolineales bacterium]|nr:PAS domain S-box protein [Anaerolineales bacterium]
MSFNPRTFAPNLDADLPHTLKAWRERLLDWLLRAILVFWLAGLVIGLLSIFIVGRRMQNLTFIWQLIGFYVVVAALMVIITFLQRLGYATRAAMFLFLVFLFGVADLVLRAYNSDGRLFLVAFAVLTAIFFDFRHSVYALLISTGTLLFFAVVHVTSLHTILPLAGQAEGVSKLAWVNSITIFLLINVTLVTSVSYLIRSLDNSVAELRQERDFAATVLDTSGALVIVLAVNGRIQRFNRACSQITGYQAAEVADQYIWDHLLTPDGMDLIKTVLAQLLADQQPTAYESYLLTRQGERRLIAWTSAPLLDENGRVAHILSTGIDITSQKQTEAERSRLLAAEHEQRLIAETLAEATLSLAVQTRPEDLLDQILNQVQRIVPFAAAHIMLLAGDTLQIARWQGYSQYGGEDFISHLLQSLSALPLEKEVVASRQPLVIADTRQEPRWVVFDETAWVRSHMVVPILQQDHVLALLRLDGNTPSEFTEQDAQRLQHLATTIAIALQNSRLLEETQQKAEQVQRILDTVQDGILLLDAHCHVELANPAARAHLSVLADFSPDKPLKSLGSQPLRDLLQPPPAGTLWHEISLQKPPRTFEALAQPIKTQSGGWVLVLRDITESRRQQQYVQAQERLAMVGQMAAGIAHDFNNIMTVIILYTQMLLKMPDLSGELSNRLDTILQQSKLAANLISQILDFSRLADVKRQPVHLLPFLKELAKLLRRTLPENINLSLDYAEGDYLISADLTRVQQAVMNLVVNARDAMPNGGKLRLNLRQIEVTETGKRPLPDMLPGQWICLEVTDNGIGIPHDVLPRIFEPLFTTKERGKGTGLGLAQVHGIIKQHQGYVGVESIVGEGTTFRLYFPALLEALPVQSQPVDMNLMRGNGQTILVVEDEEITREAICAILETYNYRTIASADGEEALRLFDYFANDIALVLSDMVMPGMTGAELYARLHEKSPDIKMLIITGYPFAEEDRQALRHAIVGWIPKPFDVEHIVAAIQEALTAARAP